MRASRAFLLILVLILPFFLISQTNDFNGLSFCFDPGHGYHANQGAYGYSEAEKNLRVALYCLEYFQALNPDTVILTRYTDNENPSLSQRENIANSAGVTWFHSIHSNAGPTWVNNVLVLYEEARDWNQLCPGSTSNYMGLGYAEWQGQSDVMGALDSDWIARGFRIPSLGGFLDWTFYGGCASGFNLGVLNDLIMPGELSEAGYHTNPTQNLLCMNEDWKRIQARAHLETFKEYFGIDHSGFNTVTGIVRDADRGKPLNGVQVTLLDPQKNPLADFDTDTYESLFHNWCTPEDSCSNGFYIFENVDFDSVYLAFNLDYFYPETMKTAVLDTSWTFVDASLVSTIPPIVVWTRPANGDTSFSVNASWKFQFSRAMNPESVEEHISINPELEGVFYWEDDYHRLVFDPAYVLDFNATFTVTLSGECQDQYGHYLDGNADSTGGDDFTITFKTAANDRFPPMVEETLPSGDYPEIGPIQPINIIYNETLEENSITPEKFLLMTGDQEEVSIAQDYHTFKDKGIVSVLPLQAYPATDYLQLDIFPGISDLRGNVNQEHLTFVFHCDRSLNAWKLITGFTDLQNWEVYPGESSVTLSQEDTISLPLLGTGIGLRLSTPGFSNAILNYADSSEILNEHVVHFPVYSDGSEGRVRLLFRESAGNGEATPWFVLNLPGWHVFTFNPLSDSLGQREGVGNGVIEGELTLEGIEFDFSTSPYPLIQTFFQSLLLEEVQSAVNEEMVNALPEEFNLLPPYPNPFNSIITIPIELSSRARVLLSVYNLNGQLVDKIYNGQLTAGRYNLRWEAGHQGSTLSSGVYFLTLQIIEPTYGKRHTFSQKLLYIK